jgi:hypothetical protein
MVTGKNLRMASVVGVEGERTMTKRQRMKTRAPCYPLGFVFVIVLKINAKI